MSGANVIGAGVPKTQPTGLKAFGWGLLGFFGANLIVNITVGVGTSIVVESAGTLTAGAATMTMLVLFSLAIGLAWYWKEGRKYSATATGAKWAIVLAVIKMIAVLIAVQS